MYFGLQTGWISMMSLQASLLGFAIFKPFQHTLSPNFGPRENVFLQTVAVATATMPLAAGFVGIIPALGQLTAADHPNGPIVLSAWQLMLWSLGLSFFGVFFAVPLRKQTIIKEQLKFPSGTATAQMITLLHDLPDTNDEPGLRQRRILLQPDESHELSDIRGNTTTSTAYTGSDHSTWSLKLRALLISFSLSSVYTLLSYFFPIIYALPVFNWVTLNYVDFKAWEWYFTPSLSYIGQGIIMGLPTTLSMLLGCIVGWGILSPLAHVSGWAPGPISDWKSGSKGWILWISLGVMISESIVSLLVVLIKQLIVMIRSRMHNSNTTEENVLQRESLMEDYQDDDMWRDDENLQTELEQDVPIDQQVPLYMTVIGMIAAIILCVITINIVFGSDIMPVGMTLLSIVFAMFLSVLGVRALGETDLNPVSGIGKISQILAGIIMPGAIVANLIAGGIAEAGAQQAGDLMQDLKTGYLLGASPKAQFYGQLIGSLFSSFVATGAYLLYTTVYTIPGPEFPAPTAQVWLDMSRLVNGHDLPPHVFEFIIAFAVLFGVLVIVKETGPTEKGWRQFIPQGIAFAIGIYNPPSFTLARVIGGLIASYWEKYCDSGSPGTDGPYKKIGKIFIVIVASGFVLGEGTFAIVNMSLHALKVPHF
ncbi:hypothetical protein MFLAVUS_008615 [Mucor flavus]|uniref:Oligopeptide transporter n=1 Tax=Mucor flavus TaxID=439312 RepID=A0ABP9Z7P0_9FUNG